MLSTVGMQDLCITENPFLPLVLPLTANFYLMHLPNAPLPLPNKIKNV